MKFFSIKCFMPANRQKYWKFFFLWTTATLLFLFICMGIFSYALFYFSFMRCNIIHAEYVENIPCQMEIPVRYIDRWLTEYKGVAIRTRDQWNYSLRVGDSPGHMWITICRWGLGSLTVYTARYEITDSEVRKKLLELWRKANQLLPETEHTAACRTLIKAE